MRSKSKIPKPESSVLKGRIDLIRRAFREFLALPSIIILLFILLAVGMYILERSEWQLSSPIRSFLEARVFADANATSNLLSTIAGSIITVTSITITLLLLIVQQTASSLTSQVFDQFLRRRSNQIYFGFFIGLALYTLITLATVDEPFNPVMGAGLAFLLTIAALFLLILLFYSTINQMRPDEIVQSIYHHTQRARNRQREFLARTRRAPLMEKAYVYPVESVNSGYVTGINLEKIVQAIEATQDTCEVVLIVTIGTFVAYRDELAEVWLTHPGDITEVEGQIRHSINLEQSRNMDNDPAYGIDQLGMIAWSAASPAKGNLPPVLHTLNSLTDLLSRWTYDDQNHKDDKEVLPIVYTDDIVQHLFSTIESLAVIASQTKEHQVLGLIFQAFSRLMPRIKEEWQDLPADSLRRILPVVDNFVLTYSLEIAIRSLIKGLQDCGKLELAGMLEDKLILLKDERN